MGGTLRDFPNGDCIALSAFNVFIQIICLKKLFKRLSRKVYAAFVAV
jgi:hypothetical protein